MDDANLSKLSVNQNGLRPAFNANITNYDLIVASDVELLNVTPVTSDRGASFSIKSKTGFGDDVKLIQGENNIIIEVTSEDGTAKIYQIKCVRLSAADAKLKQINFKVFKLFPDFEPGHFEYSAKCDYKTTEEKFSFELFDFGCNITVLCNNMYQTKLEDSCYVLHLNHGRSEVLINVTSPDKSHIQVKVQTQSSHLKLTVQFHCLRNIEF